MSMKLRISGLLGSTVFAIAGLLGSAPSLAQNAYITNYASSSVSVVDTRTNTITATIGVSRNESYGVAVSPDGSRVYVTTFYSGSLQVIDAATNTVGATLSVGDYPYSVAVSPDGSRVYVANWGFQPYVAVINAATNTVTATINVGGNPGGGVSPDGVAVSPDGSRVYVTYTLSGYMAVINTATDTVVSTIYLGDYAQGIPAVSPDGPASEVASMAAASGVGTVRARLPAETRRAGSLRPSLFPSRHLGRPFSTFPRPQHNYRRFPACAHRRWPVRSP
jgi:YVTN family beta-propeller protein